MEETVSSLQTLKVSFCQDREGESQPVRDRGRTLVSILFDRNDISLLVLLDRNYCCWLFTLVNAHYFHQKNLNLIFISVKTDTVCARPNAECYKHLKMHWFCRVPCTHISLADRSVNTMYCGNKWSFKAQMWVKFNFIVICWLCKLFRRLSFTNRV